MPTLERQERDRELARDRLATLFDSPAPDLQAVQPAQAGKPATCPPPLTGEVLPGDSRYASAMPTHEGRDFDISLNSGGSLPLRARESLPADQPSLVPDIPLKLTRLQAAFVDAYLASPTLNAGGAMQIAYTACGRNADAMRGHVASGHAMLLRPAVASEIARRRRGIEKAVDAQVVQMETLLARAAFADLRTLYDDQGQLRPPQEWPDDIAAAVAGIEQEETITEPESGQGTVLKRQTKLKLVDKLAALRILMQRRGIGQDKDQGGGIVAHFHFDLPGAP